MLKRFLFFLLVICLFAGCFADTSSNATNEEQDNIPILLKKPEKWGDAPNFTAVRVGGGDFMLSALKGKVVLLSFWSVDCPACKMQIPVLGQLYKKYNREKLEIVGVCLSPETAVQRFTKSVEMNYILALLNQDMANKYGRDLRFIPFTLVIDQQGNIYQKHVGLADADVLEKEIKELLEKTDKSVKLPNTKKQDTNNNQ